MGERVEGADQLWCHGRCSGTLHGENTFTMMSDPKELPNLVVVPASADQQVGELSTAPVHMHVHEALALAGPEDARRLLLRETRSRQDAEEIADLVSRPTTARPEDGVRVGHGESRGPSVEPLESERQTSNSLRGEPGRGDLTPARRERESRHPLSAGRGQAAKVTQNVVEGERFGAFGARYAPAFAGASSERES